MKAFIAVLALLLALPAVGQTKIDPKMVNATGTPSATTFLRGDGAWAAADVSLVGEYVFPALATVPGSDCDILMITLSGSQVGAVCAASPVGSGLPSRIAYSCWVESPNLVVARICNVGTTVSAGFPQGAAIKVRVWNP